MGPAVLPTAQAVDPRLPPLITLRSKLAEAIEAFGDLVHVILQTFKSQLSTLDPFHLPPVPLFCRSSKPFKINGHFSRFWRHLSPFRINTCKSVSKQTTLSTFRINIYEKRGEGGRLLLTRNSKIENCRVSPVAAPIFSAPRNGSALSAVMGASAERAFRLQERRSCRPSYGRQER
jgi:hypothetical protein